MWIRKPNLLVASARRFDERLLVSYQFSLAVPARPLWPGIHHASEGILDIVKAEHLPLLAWSAQARGWFALPDEPPPAAAPDGPAAFDTAANREARIRCRALASAHDVAPTTIALAWTLAQDGLNVYPIIGPEIPTELAESVAAERLQLAARDVAWLTATRDLEGVSGSASRRPS